MNRTQPAREPRFVNKTYQDYENKPQGFSPPPTQDPNLPNAYVSPPGQPRYLLPGWKENNTYAPEGETNRLRLMQPPVPQQSQWDEIQTLSITTSLQGIALTYTPLTVATLYSLGSPMSIKLVKLAGQSGWRSFENTDSVFVVLRGAINLLFRASTGEQRMARCVGGELLRIPMRIEHCVVAEEGTEALLFDGNEVLPSSHEADYRSNSSTIWLDVGFCIGKLLDIMISGLLR